MFVGNGRILTLESTGEIANYLKVEENKIAQVGQGELVKSLVIDLNGKTLIPGLIDTHMHLLNYGLALQALDLKRAHSIKELLEIITEGVKGKAKETWIFGRGWDENRYGGSLPTRWELDQIAPDHPLVLSRVCGHLLLVNSRTLELLGIDEKTPIPSGGTVDRNSSGELTGIFRESAMDLIFDALPERELKEVEAALKLAGENLIQQGITTIHTDDLGEFTQIAPVLELYQQLYQASYIPRVHLHIRPKHVKEAISLGYKTGTRLGGVTIGAVKIFADGSLGARTAALKDDYTDAPGEKGILIYSDEELYQMAYQAHSHDFALAIHGIGDAAAAQVIRIFRDLQRQDPKPHLRHRLIHAQILDEDILNEMARLGIIAEIQPIFINTDLHWAEAKIGSRMKQAYNWQTMWEKGIHLSGSSDCPVEPVNPFWGIYAAVNRKDLQGEPDGGWYPKEALRFEQALRLFTVNGAYTGAEEGAKGRISSGYLADFVILDQPIDQIPTEEIKNIQVLLTVIDGKIVYNRLSS